YRHHSGAEALVRMMMLAAGLNDLRIEERGARRDRNLRNAGEPRAPVRNQRTGKKLQVSAVRERKILRLYGVVGITGVNLGCRLRWQMRLRGGSKRDFEGEPISLQHAGRRGDHKPPRQLRHSLVAVQHALGHVRYTAIEVGQNRPVAAFLKAKS